MGIYIDDCIIIAPSNAEVMGVYYDLKIISKFPMKVPLMNI